MNPNRNLKQQITVGELTADHLGLYVQLDRPSVVTAERVIRGHLVRFVDAPFMQGVNARPGRIVSLTYVDRGGSIIEERFGPFRNSHPVQVNPGRPRRGMFEPEPSFPKGTTSVRIYFEGGPKDGKIEIYRPSDAPDTTAIRHEDENGKVWIYAYKIDVARPAPGAFGRRYELRGTKESANAKSRSLPASELQ